LWASGGRGGGCGFQVVVERREFAGEIAAAQRTQDEMVGEGRVLRQYGAVQIGSDRVVGDRSFELGVLIVAPSFEYLAQWLLVGQQGRLPGMVLEADKCAERALNRDVADQAGGRSQVVARNTPIPLM